MIIYIDKTIGERLKKEKLTDDERALFGKLAMSRRDGKNILLGDRESLRMLEEQADDLPGRIFAKIRGKSAEDRSIIETVERVVVISYEETPKAPDFVCRRALLVSIAQAIDSGLASTCCLIGENYDDCEFYTGIGYWYCEDKGINGPRIVFENILGGGATTCDVLKRYVTVNKRLTLCVSDSDYTRDPFFSAVPAPEKGDTAKKIEEEEAEIQKSGEYFPFSVYILPVHEIENLIPIRSLEEIEKGMPNLKKGLDLLKALLKVQDGRPILYYDFKSGFSSFKEPDSKVYWENIMEQLEDAPKDKNGNFEYPALGKKILELVKNNMGENGDGYITVQLDSYLKERWEEIGRLVFTWGCAYEKIIS